MMENTEEVQKEEQTAADVSEDVKMPEAEEPVGEEPSENQPDAILNYFKEALGKQGEEESFIELLRHTEKNYGVKFSEASIQNATFVINQAGKQGDGEAESEENICGILGDDGRILRWCSDHYGDAYFFMFLAVCIMDEQPYDKIYDMSRELMEAFLTGRERGEREPETSVIYKSRVIRTLGLIDYKDVTISRGEKAETDFLRFPLREQADYYIRLICGEYLDIKEKLSLYLVTKIDSLMDRKTDFVVVSRSIEALSWISILDVSYFNQNIIPIMEARKKAPIDYALAIILYYLYKNEQCQSFVRKCVENWSCVDNSPHYPLTALYVCALVGNQDCMVEVVWKTVLRALVKESRLRRPMSAPYHSLILDFFDSGDRDTGYYKGFFRGFYGQLCEAEEKRDREARNHLSFLFLLFLMQDCGQCDMRRDGRKKQDMISVRIYEKLDEKGRVQLSHLWVTALKDRKSPKVGWTVLEDYLLKYDDYREADIDRLAEFFLYLEQEYGGGAVSLFLLCCCRREKRKAVIAGAVYQRMKKEK